MSYMSKSTPQSGASTPKINLPFVDEFEEPLHGYNQPSANEMATNTDNLLICTACGTQFDIDNPALLTRCRICDDPRQFVPPTGQAFTTLGDLKKGEYKNKWKAFDGDQRFWSIWTEPKFAIGQRAVLVKTDAGNILWDCITFLDKETIEWIDGIGGLAAMVISHPHYYSTHLEWAQTFSCPVYLAWEDKEWLNRLDRLGASRTFIQTPTEEIFIQGQSASIHALKLGGHFPGSLVLLAHNRLLIADTLVTSPAGLGDWSKGPGERSGEERPEGMNTYSFMWSIPNMIPLNPDEIAGMWKVLKDFEFESTHGAFVGTDVRDGGGGSKKKVKQRVLESMQIQVKYMGHPEHAFLKEKV